MKLPSPRPTTLLRRLRDLVRKDRLEREMDDELAFHLERETEENLRRGLAPDAARREARRSLGMPERVKEECRRVHGFTRLETVWGDLRFALRGLRRQPGFTAAAVVTLALGIGATTGLFSVVRGVLLRPLPFQEPEELVQVLGHDRREAVGRGTISYPNFVDVRSRAGSFASMAVYDEWTVLMEGEDGAGAERLPGASVSAGYFDTLGVAPAAGRFFLPEEDEPGSARVVVLAHGLWARAFGAYAAVIGRSLTLNGRPYRVIGVAPERLEDPGLSGASFAAPELWRPPPGYFRDAISRDGRSLTAIARLQDGVRLEAARSELDALMRGLEEAYPEENAHATMTAVPLTERLVGDVRRPLLLLLAASALVLLIACANVANLLLARSERRSGELAVRAMVGASRGRILRQLGVESLTLAALGAVSGLGVALAGTRLLTTAGAEQIPRWAEVRLDGAVLGFAAATAVLTALVFGLAPALRVLRTDLNATIDRSRRGGGMASGGGGVSRKLLIGAEVALSVVLLVGSLLLLQSLATIRAVDPGMAAERLLTAELTLPSTGAGGPYDDRPAALALYARLTERAASLPGAESAAAINILPLSGSFDGQAFTIPSRPEPAPGDEPRAEVRAVTPGFFRTAGIPILEGRSLEPGDGPQSVPAAALNRAAAERYWPGERAVGQRIEIRGATREIVGVAGDVRQFALDRPAEPAVYLPQAQAPAWMWIDSTVLVRTETGPSGVASAPEDLAAGLRGTIRELDPRIAVTGVAPMDRVIGDTLEQARFRTVLLAAFAGLALILGAVGLYGVVAYATAGRRRELGIRLALGAQRHRVITLVMREGLVPALLGALAGLAAALGLSLALSRLLGDLLYRVDPADPLLHAGATLALLLPARRATRADPVETLRA